MTAIEFTDHSTVRLHKTNACDEDVALAARASLDVESYAKTLTPERTAGLINFLVKNHHTSPLEHGSFTFVVETPIFVAREFMRHRTWSYNEVSGRYSQLRPRVYLPDVAERPLQQVGKPGAYAFDAGTSEQRAIVRRRMSLGTAAAFSDYEELLRKGVAKEVARNILPVSTMTTFWATANPLNVFRFLALRTDETALHEIRDVACQIEQFVESAMPVTFAAVKEHGL